MSEKNNIIKYKNPSNFNIGVIIFFIIIIYVLFNIFSFFTKTHIAEYQVQQGTIASNNIFQGIIIRDETIEYASKGGFINYYVKNGDKVSATDIIYSIDTVGDISSEISEASNTSDALPNDTLISISGDINTFVKDYDSNQFSESYTFYNNLNSEITKNININALADLSSKVDIAKNNNTFFQYTSPADGVIVYEIDGFENYTVEEIISSDFNYNSYKETQLFTNTEIEENSPVYKRINSEDWSIIVPINEELAKELNEKSSLKIRFCKDDFTTNASCSLLRNEDSYYLKLSLRKAMIRYANDRFIDIELVMSDDTGLKIPKSAITSKEFFTVPKEYFTVEDSNNTGLLVKQIVDDAETVKLIHPTVYYETDKHYYIDSEYVVNGDIILMPNSTSSYKIGTDTASIIGVYNINKGYAVFKQINIIYENEEYAIVETKTTYGISLYDHIALNASEVIEHQLTSK